MPCLSVLHMLFAPAAGGTKEGTVCEETSSAMNHHEDRSVFSLLGCADPHWSGWQLGTL